LDASESRSEIPGKFRNVLVVKDAVDQMDRSCEKLRSINKSQGGQEYSINNKNKANWIGHILRRNCLLKHVIGEKLERRMEGGKRMKT
jgi:predicted ATPase